MILLLCVYVLYVGNHALCAVGSHSVDSPLVKVNHSIKPFPILH